MPNIAVVLKEEIRRLARKEVRAATKKLQEDNLSLKRNVSKLKQRLAELERKNKRLSKAAVLKGAGAEASIDGGKDRTRISAKAIRTLRSRLGLTQAELAKLLNVSSQSVYQWESKEGTLRLRSAPKAAVLAVRDMGKKEAHARLKELKSVTKKAGGRRGPRKSAKSKARGKAKAKGRRKPGRPRRPR